MSQKAARSAEPEVELDAALPEAGENSKKKKKQPKVQKKKPAKNGMSKGTLAVLITAGAVVLALGGVFIYGMMLQNAMIQRLGSLPAPNAVQSWVASDDTTNMTLNSLEELNAYEQQLIAQGAQVVSRGINTVVLQQGLTDIILLKSMSGGGQVIVLPGEEIDWPLDAITQELPRPINCSLVQVDTPDDVTASYVFRGCRESTARGYVQNLINVEGWTMMQDEGFAGSSGPFMVQLAREACLLTVDYYAGGSGFVVFVEMS